jgi:hypothetical protein
MIKRHTRQARTAGDLKRGDWKPLDVALGLKRKSGQRGLRRIQAASGMCASLSIEESRFKSGLGWR